MNREEIEKLAEVEYPDQKYEIEQASTLILRKGFIKGYTQALPKWISIDDKMPEEIPALLRNDADWLTPEQTFDLMCLTENGDYWKNRRVKMRVGDCNWVWLTNLTEDKITHFLNIPTKDIPTPSNP